jgi:hypothetical protein
MSVGGQPGRRHLRAVRAADITPCRPTYDWGPWDIDPDTAELYNDDHDYAVDLETCRTPAQVLDWITQVTAKTWADDRTLAGLLRALDDVLNPQARLCPGGRSRRLSRANVAELVAHAADRHAQRP